MDQDQHKGQSKVSPQHLHCNSMVIVAHDHMMDEGEIAKMRDGGVDTKALMVSEDARVWSDPQDFQRSIAEMDGFLEPALARIGKVHALCQSQADRYVLVRSAEDIEQAHRTGRCGLLLGMEGGKPVGDSLEGLHRLYEVGLRQLQVTWAFRNRLAAGQEEPIDDGLTALGRAIVQEAGRLGIVIDVTHLSQRSFWGVLEASAKPPILSHGGARSFCPDLGNLTDDQLRALAKHGGVVGVHFVSHVVKAPDTIATVDDVVDHISYLADKMGIDHVGIGADYFPYDDAYIEAQKKFMEMVNLGERGNVAQVTYAQGLESIALMENLTIHLCKRGFRSDDVRKVLGLNLLRVYREVLG